MTPARRRNSPVPDPGSVNRSSRSVLRKFMMPLKHCKYYLKMTAPVFKTKNIREENITPSMMDAGRSLPGIARSR
jgi:hypothetical protein